MHSLKLPWPVLDRATILRGAKAGAAWGVTIAGALLGISFYQCGTICLGQVIDTTALSLASGMMTIGPLALFGRKQHIHAP